MYGQGVGVNPGRVHSSYSNPAFAGRELALATREARPNQKLSRFGTDVKWLAKLSLLA